MKMKKRKTERLSVLSEGEHLAFVVASIVWIVALFYVITR